MSQGPRWVERAGQEWFDASPDFGFVTTGLSEHPQARSRAGEADQ